MLAYHLDTQVWLEWVDSDSNWVDGVSRDFDQDQLAKKLGFSLQFMVCDMEWWGEDWGSLWRTTERLCGRPGVGG